MHAPDARAARTWGALAGCLVLAVAFPWVNSEWKGGWLQAIGGASLIAVPAGLVVWGIQRADSSTPARIILRSLLIVAVLLSLAGIYSYGIYTTPWLLAPLWVAARRAGPRERFVWIVLAMPCAHITGWLLSFHFEHRVTHVPISFTILVAVMFFLTTRSADTDGNSQVFFSA